MTRPSRTPQEVVERCLAGDCGFGRVVMCEDQYVSNLRWAISTLTTNGETRTRVVTIVAMEHVAGGVGVGTATGRISNLDDADALVQQARQTALSAPPAEDVRDLPDGSHPSVGKSDWTDGPEISTSSDLTPITSPLGEALHRSPSQEIELFGYAEQRADTLYLGTSAGVRLRFVQRAARLEHCGKSHARTRSAWAGWSGEQLSESNISALNSEVNRGLDLQGTKISVDPGRHPVVLSASAAGDLLVSLYWASTARHARDGRSAFSTPHGGTRIGEQLTTSEITLTSDPDDLEVRCLPVVAAASSSAEQSVFDNGLPLTSTDWIRSGCLTSLVASRHEAAETHITSTPSIDNLRVSVAGGNGNMWDLAAAMGDGLMVTSFWYIRSVDPQTMLYTGLTRDGVYVVRGGEVVGATGNFRFNESPLQLISSITHAGNSGRTLVREWADYFLRTAIPALAVSEFNFSTPSDAI